MDVNRNMHITGYPFISLTRQESMTLSGDLKKQSPDRIKD